MTGVSMGDGDCLEETDRLVVEVAERVKRELVAEHADLMQAVDVFGDPLARQHLVDALHLEFERRVAVRLARLRDGLFAAGRVRPGEHGAH